MTKPRSNWAASIPLLSVIVAALAVGGALAELHWVTVAMDRLTAKVERLDDATARRLTAVELAQAAMGARRCR